MSKNNKFNDFFNKLWFYKIIYYLNNQNEIRKFKYRNFE